MRTSAAGCTRVEELAVDGGDELVVSGAREAVGVHRQVVFGHRKRLVELRQQLLRGG